METASTNDLRRELVRSAQENRLLADVLGAIAAASTLDDVVQILRVGISGVLPGQRWPAIRLLLTSANRREVQSIELGGSGVSRYWANVRAGALAAGRGLGVRVDVLLGSATSQVELLAAALRDQADAIAVAPIDPQGCEPGFAAARRAGVPLVVYDTPGLPGSAALAYIGTDNEAAGRLAGETLRRLLPEGGLIGASCDSLSAENGRQRIAGFSAALERASYPQIPVIEEQFDAQLGMALATAALSSHPELRGVFGSCGSTGPTWAAALERAGKRQQVRLVCFDLGADAIQLLTDGGADVVVSQREYTMGYQAVELLARMLVNGTEPTLAQLPPQRVIDTGVDVVTLSPTPWSTSLASYLTSSGAQRPTDPALRQAFAQRSQPARIVVIGMQEAGVTIRPPALIGAADAAFAIRAIGQGQTAVASTAAPELAALADVARASAAGHQLMAAVPLIAGSEPLGALVVESPYAGDLAPLERVQLERLASAVAVAIQNARLLQRLEQRAAELSAANARQQELLTVINELSSPVVPIVAGVLVLPLVGAMDSQRATRFLETLLEAISARQAEVVLIDISGVPVVDTGVAFHLTQAARATRLLGAEAVLSGITAPVAQTLIGLAVDLSDLRTFADLQSAFAYALTRVGGRLTFAA